MQHEEWIRLGGLIAGIVATALLGWFVLAKYAYRVLKRLRIFVPCPSHIAWYLDIRWGRWRRRAILDAVGIKEGETVLEVGCGNGVFTAAAAERAGAEGRVIALDMQEAMVDKARRRWAMTGSPSQNVEWIVGDVERLPLSDGSVDRAFLVDVLGEVYHAEAAVAELRRVIRPGGVLCVTQEFFDPDYLWRWEVRRMALRAGFTPAGCDGGLWLYTQRFR